MDTQLEQAKRFVEQKGYTCAIFSDQKWYYSTKRGVKPLLEFLQNNNLKAGFIGADKVVGKGAAMLYLLLGAKSLYAFVISEPALKLLQNNKVAVYYNTLVPNIINREGNGICPIEQSVLQCDNPAEGLNLIKQKLKEL